MKDDLFAYEGKVGLELSTRTIQKTSKGIVDLGGGTVGEGLSEALNDLESNEIASTIIKKTSKNSNQMMIPSYREMSRIIKDHPEMRKHLIDLEFSDLESYKKYISENPRYLDMLHAYDDMNELSKIVTGLRTPSNLRKQRLEPATTATLRATEAFCETFEKA